jgi:putative membrane protein
MADAINTSVAYCGAPPLPGELWLRWNLDPILIAALLAMAIGYHAGRQSASDAEATTRAQRASFFAGWALTAAAFLSPLCALSVALFSARAGQHMILVLVAAPFLAYGRAELALRPLLSEKANSAVAMALTRAAGPGAGVALLAAALWFWHAPAPYDATLRSDGLYWLMHMSLLIAAFLFWRSILPDARQPHAAAALAAILATFLQMGLLGALLSLSGAPVYASHSSTTLPWGLTPFEDQQLGGLLMWIPGGLILAGAALAATAHLLEGQRLAPDQVR